MHTVGEVCESHSGAVVGSLSKCPGAQATGSGFSRQSAVQSRCKAGSRPT